MTLISIGVSSLWKTQNNKTLYSKKAKVTPPPTKKTQTKVTKKTIPNVVRYLNHIWRRDYGYSDLVYTTYLEEDGEKIGWMLWIEEGTPYFKSKYAHPDSRWLSKKTFMSYII